MLDLTYGLPVQVRDHALRIKDDLPRSDANREYYLQNVDAQLGNSDVVGPGGALGKLPSHKSELLAKLARTTPYYKRNRPHICSFWVKGECKRGEECPYRHDKPTDPDDPLSDHNIKDRYYGTNDPVADKLLKRAQAMPHLEPPEDRLITTLYVGGLDESVTEQDIKNSFYAYGEIRNTTMVPKQGCAFVQFNKRSAAELAAEKTFNKLVIRGLKLTIRWGKSQGKQTTLAPEVFAAVDNNPALPGSLPPPPLPPPLPPASLFRALSLRSPASRWEASTTPARTPAGWERCSHIRLIKRAGTSIFPLLYRMFGCSFCGEKKIEK